MTRHNGYLAGRQVDFAKIRDALTGEATLAGENFVVAEADSLAALRKLPDQSVSLVMTDPPYHATKKRNIYGDTAFEQDTDYVAWIEKHATEWRRALKPNGSLYVFCASEMAARLEVMFSERFNILAHITWTKPNDPGYDGWKQKMKKEALRQWYAHSERILFMEPKAEGNLFKQHFANVLRDAREKAGRSQHALTGEIGAYGKVNHGGAVSNWEAGRNTPSRDQYQKICEAVLATGNTRRMPLYEDLIRPFETDATQEFTDVWTFPNVRPYKGKHPAEKPAALLEHAIAASSYPGDIVVDCFAGSGSTALAALKLGRRTVAIEIDPRLAQRIAEKISPKSFSQRKHSRAELKYATKREVGSQLPLLLDSK
jgi:site-specific DNA-methyltransferase (adenine-specific)